MTLPSLSILDILQAELRRNVNASTLTWLKIHEPTRVVAALMHFQWIAPWFQEFSLPDIAKISESNESRLTLDWTYPTRPSYWKWYQLWVRSETHNKAALNPLFSMASVKREAAVELSALWARLDLGIRQSWEWPQLWSPSDRSGASVCLIRGVWPVRRNSSVWSFPEHLEDLPPKHEVSC